MAEQAEKVIPAAYLPFKTFLTAIEVLEQGVPTRLDRTMWRSQSGMVQGQIMAAFRFLGLLSDNDEPTAALTRLVSEKERRPELIGLLIQSAYAEVFSHDLTKMTPKMLDDAIGQYGVQGHTRRKATAFFLRAALYAELPMHPALTAQTRNQVAGPRRKRRKSNGTDSEDSEAVNTLAAASNGTTKVVRLPSGTVITLNISANWLEMSQEERSYVFGLVDKLQDVPSSVDSDEETDE